MTDSMNTNRARPPQPRLLTAAAALAVAAAIAACGSSAPAATGSAAAAASSTGSSSSSSSAMLAFSKCMRANGVPNFPDLSSNGLRVAASGQTISVNGVSVKAPAFASARQKCEPLMPHTRATQGQSAQQARRGLQFSRCMRGHGAPNFPDPKAIGGGGANHVAYLPGVNLGAPAVQAAAKACGGFGPKGP